MQNLDLLIVNLLLAAWGVQEVRSWWKYRKQVWLWLQLTDALVIVYAMSAALLKTSALFPTVAHVMFVSDVLVGAWVTFLLYNRSVQLKNDWWVKQFIPNRWNNIKLTATTAFGLLVAFSNLYLMMAR